MDWQHRMVIALSTCVCICGFVCVCACVVGKVIVKDYINEGIKVIGQKTTKKTHNISLYLKWKICRSQKKQRRYMFDIIVILLDILASSLKMTFFPRFNSGHLFSCSQITQPKTTLSPSYRAQRQSHMETLLPQDKSFTVAPAPNPTFFGKKFTGTNINAADGALPSLSCLQMAGHACPPLRTDIYRSERFFPTPHNIIPYNLSCIEWDSLHKLVRPSAHVWITACAEDARQHAMDECCLLSCSQRPPPASEPPFPCVYHIRLY